MIRKKYKMGRAFSSLLIILSLLLGLNVNAFAETSEDTEASKVSVGITNILRAKKNIVIPDATFQYSYTKDGIVNYQDNGSESINREVFADDTQPNLVNTKSQLSAEYKHNMDPYQNMIDNKVIYKKIGDNIIPEASDFKHAGIYSYTIKQEPINEGVYSKYLTCSKAVYKLFVYVMNENDGLTVSGATAYKVNDDNGDAIESPSKIDLTKNTYAPEDGSDLCFINDYNPDNVGFTILNNISGNYADMTKTFAYELTMLNPEGVTGEHTYKAVMIDENTNLPISDNLLSFTTDQATAFNMKNKQRLTFVKDEYVINKEKELTAEDTDFLPAGTSFIMSCKANPSYLCKYVLTIGGRAESMQVGNMGKSVLVNNKYLNLGLNQLDITQAYKWVTVTGVVAKTMPAFILLMFAVFGIAISGRSRRRNVA